MDVLRRILEEKAREVAGLRPRRRALEAAARDAAEPRGFARALRSEREVRVVAEFKRRAPSAGRLADADADAGAVCRAYARAGAAALSVLTDAAHFGGSLDDLRAARSASSLPVLRKDFVIDPVQVSEARAAGADAVLLIARALDAARLADLAAAAADAGMDALVEVHDGGELASALSAGATLVGINSRDLATFDVDLGRIEALAEEVPEHVTLVGESGVRDAADVRRLGAAGVHAVLVGSALMGSGDAGAAARGLVGHQRMPRVAAGRPAGGA